MVALTPLGGREALAFRERPGGRGARWSWKASKDLSLRLKRESQSPLSQARPSSNRDLLPGPEGPLAHCSQEPNEKLSRMEKKKDSLGLLRSWLRGWPRVGTHHCLRHPSSKKSNQRYGPQKPTLRNGTPGATNATSFIKEASVSLAADLHICCSLYSIKLTLASSGSSEEVC